MTRAAARASAERSLASLSDQEPDISDAAYQLLVVELAPQLLQLTSVDPSIRGAAQGRIRALANRYRVLVENELRVR